MEEITRNGEEPADDRIEIPDEETGTEIAGFVPQQAHDELNDKYLRLYADFENYRKRMQRDRDELQKFANETLLYDLLPAIDNLELALKHASAEQASALVQGVEATLREMHRTLEKHGLSRIEASGRTFDPSVHHAMSQVERADLDEQMVAEEFRPGYRYRDKVLRPSLVAVSVRSKDQGSRSQESDANQDTEEEA